MRDRFDGAALLEAICRDPFCLGLPAGDLEAAALGLFRTALLAAGGDAAKLAAIGDALGRDICGAAVERLGADDLAAIGRSAKPNSRVALTGADARSALLTALLGSEGSLAVRPRSMRALAPKAPAPAVPGKTAPAISGKTGRIMKSKALRARPAASPTPDRSR